jgi:signal transduction histidine kinase
VQRVTERHNGRVSAHRRHHGGASFRLSLPIRGSGS